jgi:hypothetical protein
VPHLTLHFELLPSLRASPDRFLRVAGGFDAPSDEIAVRKAGIDHFAKRKGRHNAVCSVVSALIIQS